MVIKLAKATLSPSANEWGTLAAINCMLLILCTLSNVSLYINLKYIVNHSYLNIKKKKSSPSLLSIISTC